MNFNFTPVEKRSACGGGPLVGKTIKVTKHNIIVSPEVILQHYSCLTFPNLSYVAARTKVGILYDERQQAIKLVFGDPKGYTLRCTEKSGINGYISTTKNIQQANILLGDYIQTDEDPTIFKLV